MTLRPAAVRWREGQPHSIDFEDIYYSPDVDAEIERVFIAPSQLEERSREAEKLTIAELGFGTGRNFLAAARLCERNRCRLHFLSVEAHPFPADALPRALQDDPLSRDLVRKAPPLLPGWHRREFCNGRVVLSVYYGDADAFVRELEARQSYGVDAFFLDGFAPDKNPEMWDEALLSTLARSARQHATVATFTAAGRVRRALSGAGFEMRRVDQRPFKRESLAGVHLTASRDHAPPSQVNVIGAGIAGCSLAAHLADRGVPVQLFDEAGDVATGASAITAMQHARLLGDGTPQADWRATCYHYATQRNHDQPGVAITGALQGLGPNLDAAKLARILNRYASSGSWIQPHQTGEAMWFPDACTVHLPTLCRSLIARDAIELRLGEPNPATGVRVYACGAGITQLPEFAELAVKPLWGQIDLVEVEDPPPHARLGNGYLAPAGDQLVVGATYEYAPWDEAAATEHNLQRLGEELGEDQAYRWVGRVRGCRAVANDRTPIVGALGDVWLSGAHGSMGATSAHLAAAVIQSQLMGWVPPVSQSVEELVDPARFARRAARRAGRARS